MNKLLELFLVPFVAAWLALVLLYSILVDCLYWVYNRTVWSIWMAIYLRWEFRNFGTKPALLELIKWMATGK